MNQITTTPTQIDEDRIAVEAVWLEHRHVKDIGFKDLMLFALRKGREMQHLDDVTEWSNRIAAICNYKPPKADRDDLSIYDRAPNPRPDYAAQVDDQVRADQIAMARKAR
jgi:hypothetical protein